MSSLYCRTQHVSIAVLQDYADIMDHLIKRWQVLELTGLSPQAAQAQDKLGKFPNRIRKIAERVQTRKSKIVPKHTPFSWIYDREIPV